MKKRYSESVYRAYISEVKKSGILDSENYYPEKSDDTFSSRLAGSRYLARKEFAVCHNYLVALFTRIQTIEEEMSKDTQKIDVAYSTYKDAWAKVFDQFNIKLLNIFNYAEETLIGSFSKKIRRIDNFCICLFGRTKSGKSTTMEALTSGDGSTIGIGKQNTTQDVKEYHWNGLLVVDTPGIDAMDSRQNADKTGKKLEDMALSFADDSDLILFLLPHQIEEGDFQKFSRFYKQNKPILILLNIKDETGKKETMDFKMFLKRSSDIFNKQKVDGYMKRIQDFIFSTLHIEPGLIPIIPIHSMAAFMSSKERDYDLRKQLYEISNFRELENSLIKEIREYGELYRIKNPYDTVKLFSEMVRDEFLAFVEYLKKQQRIFKDNIVKFQNVKEEIIKRRDIITRDLIDGYFNPKVSMVSSLVDQIFEEKDQKKRENILKHFVPESEIKAKAENCQTKIASMIQTEITNFFEGFSRDLIIVDAERYKSSIESHTTSDMQKIEDLGDMSDTLAGLGTISSVVLGVGGAIVATNVTIAGVSIFGAAGTLFGLGAANIWNPVGWGIMGLSALLAVGSFFAGKKKTAKLAEAKYNAQNEIKSSVGKIRTELNEQISKWTSSTLEEIETKHIQVMREYVNYAEKHLSEIDKLSEYLKDLVKVSQKAKFQSMLRNLTKSDMISVIAVAETQQSITIKLRSYPGFDKKNIQSILARVEEKPVIVEV